MDRYLLLSFIYLSNYIFTILSCISDLPSGICLSSFWIIYLEVSSMKAICKYALSVVFVLHAFIFPHLQDSLTRYTQFYVEDYFLWNLWKILFHIIFLAVDFEFLVFGSVGSQKCEYFSYLLLYIPIISYIQGFKTFIMFGKYSGFICSKLTPLFSLSHISLSLIW